MKIEKLKVEGGYICRNPMTGTWFVWIGESRGAKYMAKNKRDAIRTAKEMGGRKPDCRSVNPLTKNNDMTTKTIQEALLEWIDASPNKTPRNTLIETRSGSRTFYGWNLKPNDPHEKDFVWIEEERGEA